MQWTTIAALPILFIVCWLYTIHVQPGSSHQLRNKRICLLIAHPDDEAMFFAPTMLALTKEKLGNHVKILCLSSGNADGLGETRKDELSKSGKLLGLRKEDDIFVVEDPQFPDSMTTSWDADQISTLLAAAFAPNLSTTPSGSSPTATIDILITFDRDGISSHPNHISLHRGAVAFLKLLMRRHKGWECPVTLYTLTTTNVLRKYLSILDTPMTMIQCVLRREKKSGGTPTPLLFIGSPMAYWTAQRAMTAAHKSQMRWFRWGWIVASRYMVVNDLKIEKDIR